MDKVQKIRKEIERMQSYTQSETLKDILDYIDSLQEEPVSSVWHNASEEPTDKANCLIYYKVGDKVSYQDVFPVLYHKERKEFVSEPYPHPTVHKVELKSLEGGVTAVVYKNMRDKFPLTDISKWAYLEDLLYKQEEPVSEDLKEAAKMYTDSIENEKDDAGEGYDMYDVYDAFKAGAKWQKEHLWKSADGDDLPEYEREVVVFTQNFPDDAGIMSVAIGHRPNPDGWDAKSLASGKVEHYTPKTYDKGGWNIQNVKYWLDVELPKEIEL